MDKYQEMRQQGDKLVADVINMSMEEAGALCEAAGFSWRLLSIDCVARMITADVRMDRVGFDVRDGLVTHASIG